MRGVTAIKGNIKLNINMNTDAASKLTAKNPWFNPRGPYSSQSFDYDRKECLLNYRGVEVFYHGRGSYHYILGETVITMRAGFSKKAGPGIIDELLDGVQPVSDNVADHITACGFNGLSYTQYIKDWEAGKRK